MGADVHVGPGLDADRGVIVGYLPERDAPRRLVLGRGARLRSGTVVYAGSRIGHGFQTGHHVVVREECEIGDDVRVWTGTVIDYGCVLGDRVKVHAGCYVAQYSRIGADAFLAPGVRFANDLYPGYEASAAAMAGPDIGPGAQLGVNVTVLPYVRVGAGSIVGAGSVVTRDVPPFVVAYGNPARVARAVEDLHPAAERALAGRGETRPGTR